MWTLVWAVSVAMLARWALRGLRLVLCWLRRGDPVVGVFHPYCDAGGGGERVLWVALEVRCFLEEKRACEDNFG